MCIDRTLAGTKYIWAVQLLTNVTLRLYLVMIPFLEVSSGGSHLMRTDVELCVSIVTFCGLPSGAADGYVVINMLPPLAHLIDLPSSGVLLW